MTTREKTKLQGRNIYKYSWQHNMNKKKDKILTKGSPGRRLKKRTDPTRTVLSTKEKFYIDWEGATTTADGDVDSPETAVIYDNCCCCSTSPLSSFPTPKDIAATCPVSVATAMGPTTTESHFVAVVKVRSCCCGTCGRCCGCIWPLTVAGGRLTIFGLKASPT